MQSLHQQRKQNSVSIDLLIFRVPTSNLRSALYKLVFLAVCCGKYLWGLPSAHMAGCRVDDNLQRVSFVGEYDDKEIKCPEAAIKYVGLS